MTGKAIRETLGFLGVIGSMLFVGLEIRQNNTALRASAIQESISVARQQAQLLASSPELVRISILANEDPSQLTDVERTRLHWTLVSFWSGMQGIYRQWALGVLPDEEWRTWQAVICANVASPSQRAFWAESSGTWIPSFVQTVESCDAFTGK